MIMLPDPKDRQTPAASDSLSAPKRGSREILREALSQHSGSILFIVILVTFFLYRGVAGHSFLAYDDGFFVTENGYVRQGLTWESIRWSWTATLGFYQPITWLSLMLDAAFFGLNAGAFHLTNLWLHLANTALVFYFLKRVTGEVGKSLLVTALFAWHPINVEAVAWIAERKGLLSMLFALLSLIAYVRYVEQPSWKRMAVVAAAMLMSLLSKSTAVVLPALFLALDYWPLKRIRIWNTDGESPEAQAAWREGARLVGEKIPLFLLSLLFVILTIRAEANLGAVRTLEQFTVEERVLNCVAAVPLYLKQLLVPSGYAPYYPIRIWSKPELLAFAGAFVLLIWSAVRHVRRNEAAAAGIVWFLICLAPVLGFVKIGTHLMADRYAYLAEIGFFVAVVWTVGDWRWMKSEWRFVMPGVACGALIFFTHHHLPNWKDDLALASNGEKVTGKNAVICYGLGIGHDKAGNRKESLRSFVEVFAYNIDYPGTHYNIARAYVLNGRPVRAVTHLKEGLRQAPDEPRYHDLLAGVLCAWPDTAVRNGAKALEHATMACQLTRNGNPLFLDTLGAAYAETGRFNEAVIAATGAMQLTADEQGRKAIGDRIRLYTEGKPFRGILLRNDAAAPGRRASLP